jgi:RNA polymerase sigma-70 factor (sigma-E family)
VDLSADNAEFRDYVAGNLDRLRRTAYLLCGDWHLADDLVSAALVKLLRHWRRLSTMDNIAAYARQVLVRTWFDERRRPWRREQTRWEVPDRSAPGGVTGITDRLALDGLLASLPPGRRAVLVLRYFCDLSVEETAEVLGCSTGNVKSQAARGLETLRGRMAELTVSKEDEAWT